MDEIMKLQELFTQPFLVLGCVLTVFGVVLFRIATSKTKQGGIPSVAPRWKGWFSASAFLDGKRYLQEGYHKCPNGFFRMPLFPMGDVIVVNGPKLISELKNGPDSIFSFVDFAARILQTRYTISRHILENRWHLPVIRTTLTRNLASIFPDMAEEMRGAFKDLFGDSTEWKQFSARSSLMDVVCRASNRVVVGETLCRNKEYQKMNVQYTVDVAKSAFLINLFPPFMHPIVAPLLSKRSRYSKMASRLLKEEIENRLANFEKYGSEWADKPNDYLMWLIEEAPSDSERNVPYLADRILHINFAAIHTSSITFTHALLHLASHPEWVKPIREEVERVVAEEGWTKASMQKMRKTDSFLRESSRMNSFGLVSIGRYMIQDYTFSDGTKVPKGSWIAASAYSAHMDDENYSNAEEFNPFRFAGLRDEAGEGTKHQMVATSPEYLPFGLGRHACPGRFFAANEIKAMLCYLAVNYDIKFPNDSVERPPNQYFGTAVIPSDADEVLLRKRPNLKF